MVGANNLLVCLCCAELLSDRRRPGCLQTCAQKRRAWLLAGQVASNERE